MSRIVKLETDRTQSVVLRSKDHFGRNVPPKALGELLIALPEAIRCSTRMAFESRSQAKGKSPEWLLKASDIRFLDHSGDDETILRFYAPRFRDVAGPLFLEGKTSSICPNPEDTGFDLLGDVIHDVATENVDSIRFDLQLLRLLEKFKKGLNGTFQSIEFNTSRPIRNEPTIINSALVEAAGRLSHISPAPQQSRLIGTLDMVHSSTNAFAIKLKDGQQVRCVLSEGKVSRMTHLIDKDVLVLGKSIFRPSGALLRIDADEVISAGQQDSFFQSISKPKKSRFDLREVLREQENRKGVGAIYGRWPGEETDQEIAIALKDID